VNQRIIDADRPVHSDREWLERNPHSRSRTGDCTCRRLRKRKACRDGQNGGIVIVQNAIMSVGVVRVLVVRDRVRLRVAMNEDFVMTVLIAFVDVLGRSERYKTHRRRQNDAEQARRVHERHAIRLPRAEQLKSP